ncbi:MAG: AAA family ATPase [Crenarchaeota archaeon]|nr:AAA family ATPase [Thermoproteota archaeon]
MRRHIVPELEIEFVNREEEFNKILSLEEGKIHIITGPRGCGKTELAREVEYTLENDEKHSIILITYETDKTNITVTPRKTIKENSKIDIVEIISEILKIRELVRRRIIIIVDEFRNIYRDDRARQMLEVEANRIRYINKELREQGGSIKLILITSDATVTYLRNIVGTKVQWYIMWNLDEKPTYEVLQKLKCPIDHHMTWKLTGGNLREIAIIKSHNWNLEKWIRIKISELITCLREYSQSENRNLISIIKEIEGNVDELSWRKIWTYLLKNNIVIEIDDRFDKMSTIPRDESIGSSVAYQVPIYYYTMKCIVEKGSLDVDPSDILRMVK